jgi:putative copper resistance protein D
MATAPRATCPSPFASGPLVSGAPDAILIAARTLHFAAACLLFGAPAFFLYAAPDASGRRLDWPRALVIGAALLAAVSGVVWVGRQAAAMSGDPADALRPAAVLAMLTDTSLGRIWIERLALLALMLVFGLVLPALRRRLLWGAMSGLGGAALALLAWTGHGGADEGAGGAIHAAADVVHLLAAGLWLGALPPLLVLAFGPAARAARGLAAFSGVGPGAVAVLIASGLVNAWFLVGPGALPHLLASSYDRLLTAKLAVFAAMLGLAALNRLKLTGAIERQGAAALPALRASLLVETLLGLAVLALVAVLGVEAPPTSL